jgi:hypothetical protein
MAAEQRDLCLCTLLYMFDGDDDGGGGSAPSSKVPTSTQNHHPAAGERRSRTPRTHRSSRGRPATSALARALLNKAKAHSLSTCVCAMTATHRPCFAFTPNSSGRSCCESVPPPPLSLPNLTTCHNHTARHSRWEAGHRERESKDIILQIRYVFDVQKDSYGRVTFVKDFCGHTYI